MPPPPPPYAENMVITSYENVSVMLLILQFLLRLSTLYKEGLDKHDKTHFNTLLMGQSSFTHPHDVSNLYAFLFSVE